MRSFDELLAESSVTHGHHCAGQVLGVRMAMVGCREVDIDEPKGCKKLVVYVEMDRCATDAVQAVTGCSLGKRTLKFLDYGKMAVTFVNLATDKAVRVLARDDSRALASRYALDATNPREVQKKAYAVMPEELLFSVQPTVIQVAEENLPGFRGTRVFCQQCGEGINMRREVLLGGRTLCIPCAQDHREIPRNPDTTPKVVLIVGYKKVGKTTLIENLIPELRRRGYRVGTVKHHHSEYPVTLDCAGTDTWRHRRAGATSVALVTPTHSALFREHPNPGSLDKILATLGGHDIVLVEGFHDEPRAKIEIVSERNNDQLCQGDGNLLALVASTPRRSSVPVFDPQSIEPLADLIEREVLVKH